MITSTPFPLDPHSQIPQTCSESEGVEYIAGQSYSSSSSEEEEEDEDEEETGASLGSNPRFSIDDSEEDFFSEGDQGDEDEEDEDEEEEIFGEGYDDQEVDGIEESGSEDGIGSDGSSDSWGEGINEDDEEGEETHTLSLVGTMSALMRAYQVRVRSGESLEAEQPHDGFSASWLLDNALTYNNLRQNFGRPSSRPPLVKIKHHTHVFRNRTNMGLFLSLFLFFFLFFFFFFFSQPKTRHDQGSQFFRA